MLSSTYYRNVIFAIILFMVLGVMMFAAYTFNTLFNSVIVNSVWYVLTFIFLCLFTFLTCDLFDGYLYKIIMTLFNFAGLTVITYFAFSGQFAAFYYWIIASIINILFSIAFVVFICPYLVWWWNGSKENNAANNTLGFFANLAKLFDVSAILYSRFFYLIGFLLLFGALWLIKLLTPQSIFVYLIIAIISILFIFYLVLIFYQSISSSPIKNSLAAYFAEIPGITWVIIVFVVILFVILFYGVLYTGSSGTVNELIYVSITIGVVLVIAGIAYKISTNDHDKSKGEHENGESKKWKAIAGSWQVILYTICLILFYCLTNKTILDQYAYIFTSLTIMISVFLFYNSFVKIENHDKNKKSHTDIAAERIKTIIIFLCAIVISILLYAVDPGGLVNTYVGPNFIYTILLGCFGFLFLSMLLRYPKQKEKEIYKKEFIERKYGNHSVYNKQLVKKTVKVSNLDSKNFFDKFKNYTIVSCVLFAIFIIAVTVIILTYPGGFFNNRVVSSIGLTIILMICILWIITLTMNLFKDSEGSKMKNVIILLLGLGFLATFIVFLISFLSNLSGETNIIRLVTNCIILLFYAAFFIRTIVPDAFLPYIHFSYFGVTYTAILIAIVLYMFWGIIIAYFTNVGFMIQVMFFALIGIILGFFSGFCSFSVGFVPFIQFTFAAAFGVLSGYVTGLISAVSSNTLNVITIIQATFFAFFGIMIGYFGGFISLFLGFMPVIQMLLVAFASIFLAHMMGLVGDLSKFIALITGVPIYVKIGALCIALCFVVWSLIRLPSGTLSTSMLVFVPIILFLIYYYFPTIKGMIATQGGNLLIDNQIPLNVLTNLSNYEALNGSNASTYKFAISFWVNIDAAPPSTNASYSRYTSIMNYGDKPNVLYNPSLNSFLITMHQVNFEEKNVNVASEVDAHGNRILYMNNDFLLQKWNNVIINYDGGTLDIFLNGELVRTTIEVIPYITMDALTVGATDGIYGNICNFVYYTETLTTTKIYYIYNSMKNENPPAPKKTNDTIVGKIEGGAVIVGNQIASKV